MDHGYTREIPTSSPLPRHFSEITVKCENRVWESQNLGTGEDGGRRDNKSIETVTFYHLNPFLTPSVMVHIKDTPKPEKKSVAYTPDF